MVLSGCSTVTTWENGLRGAGARVGVVFGPEAQGITGVGGGAENVNGPRRGWGQGQEMSPSLNPKAQLVMAVVLKM